MATGQSTHPKQLVLQMCHKQFLGLLGMLNYGIRWDLLIADNFKSS